MTEQYDVVIVGGGMVGSALGCCLGGSDLRVAVIENRRPQPFSPEQKHDLRVSALGIASRTILEMVGAWEGVVGKRFCPYRRMRVWETKGSTEFCSDDINRPELGYIVENRVTQLALLERLEDFANVTLMCPATTERIDYDPGRSVVSLADHRQVVGRVLVAADGGQSNVRQVVGMGVSCQDYKQHALVISIETAYQQRDITWQHFLPTGPQAFLPLSGPNASIVWYHTPDEIRRLKSLSDRALLIELCNAFPDCLGEVKAIVGRASFPLKRQHALDYVKPGVALIGDAAHIINPLAGQGVNIGLLDAAALAQVLVAAGVKQQDLASLAVLKQYERLRRKENLLMMTTMDLFYRVFSDPHFPVRLLRNAGLAMAERLTPAKNKVMRYAMGLEGNLPKLARGETIVT